MSWNGGWDWSWFCDWFLMVRREAAIESLLVLGRLIWIARKGGGLGGWKL